MNACGASRGSRSRSLRHGAVTSAWTALTLATLLGGCLETAMPIEDMPCPSEGTQLTYENFGDEFLSTNCNTCHSTSRAGAPKSFRFDTLEDIRLHSDRIFIRAAGPNKTMPPGLNDPPEAERDQLAEWLACGAP
jgi:uncharacterized membrane protein